MDSSEFYDYVNSEDFLKPNIIAINNKEEYKNLSKEIKNSPQINYEDTSEKEE